MPKYLIQDIIPPDRKRRKSGATAVKGHASEDRHRSTARRVHDDRKNHSEDTHPHQSPIARHAFADADNEDVPVQPENPHTAADMPRSDGIASEERDDTLVTPHSPEKVTTPAQYSSETVRRPEVTSPPPWQKADRPPLFETSYTFAGTDGRGGGGKWWWIIGAAGVGATIFLVSAYFTSATVTILPKKDKIPLDQKFLAAKIPVGDALPYAIMTITESEAREVPAAGTKAVSSKASGQIVVYNEQTVPQRLIKNTRFESPKGHIYRINDSITIPKAATQSGKLVPGSITVTVYADEPGPAYNSDPVDFTVPGLKGGPLYTKVYARSKGPITGGASGTAKIVRDADLKAAEEDLRVAIETKLRNRARAEISVNQIAYDGGFTIEIGKAALAAKTTERDENAVVEVSGRLAMVVFDRTKLTQAIARALIPTWKGEPIEIANIEVIEFGMDRTTVDALEKGEEIEFTLNGTPEFRWVIDQEGVKKTLSGMPKSRFDALMRAYPTIERATATLRPFWNRSFPDDPEKITVVFDDAPRAP